ncbi:hypothetical protein Fot_29770 [Forsythia ovata]|uniref:Uncharacterized protein n=1 Tax=Forsythia ovata TaxID=205694 RepID=A0ABD1TSU0_9LAMI
MLICPRIKAEGVAISETDIIPILPSFSLLIFLISLIEFGERNSLNLEREMGNCQAIDNASLVIQHPSGRVDKLYCPVAAKEIMKMNPGHYVALLLTTTLYSSATSTASAAATKNKSTVDNNNIPVRITRIKLLRPTDNLELGHVYRLVTTQEVMKGLWAKKHAKMKKQQPELDEMQGRIVERESSDFGAAIKKTDMEKIKQVKHERHRLRNNNTATNSSSAAAKSRVWQPALQSISEAGS